MTSHLELLRARDIRLKASLGQNLLMDANLCEKIVREARLEPGDAVLEIGPGTGALTEKLLETRARVLAVETDGRLIPLLAERFGSDENFRLVHQDFLRFPRESLEEWRAGRPVTVVANLPYYNSSQIIFRLLEWRDALLAAILTLQLELAERVAAPPGGKDYGILSV
ncbi:MAG: 16S rRNA (adenine(1518)-N(6)/adenine(1519)-N(6))-dimethyltransferase, partial [Deltaproteobacteria bacterium]|nr:16S rRNA (adenine(1518)-N(6)/adenine(1519)-N(6))-dimethyltransferase [Deltaproteobacteria bacterium]